MRARRAEDARDGAETLLRDWLDASGEAEFREVADATHSYLARVSAVATPDEGDATRRGRIAGALRDWLHESPLNQCDAGSDTCDTWPLAYELTDLVLRALASPDEGPRTTCVECGEWVSQSASAIETIHFGCFQDRRRRALASPDDDAEAE
jgi:hypothetical protein